MSNFSTDELSWGEYAYDSDNDDNDDVPNYLDHGDLYGEDPYGEGLYTEDPYDAYGRKQEIAKKKAQRAIHKKEQEALEDAQRIQHAKESRARLLAQPRKVLVNVEQPYKTNAQFGVRCDKNRYPLPGELCMPTANCPDGRHRQQHRR
jgi:hypothetical protein